MTQKKVRTQEIKFRVDFLPKLLAVVEVSNEDESGDLSKFNVLFDSTKERNVVEVQETKLRRGLTVECRSCNSPDCYGCPEAKC